VRYVTLLPRCPCCSFAGGLPVIYCAPSTVSVPGRYRLCTLGHFVLDIIFVVVTLHLSILYPHRATRYPRVACLQRLLLRFLWPYSYRVPFPIIGLFAFLCSIRSTDSPVVIVLRYLIHILRCCSVIVVVPYIVYRSFIRAFVVTRYPLPLQYRLILCWFQWHCRCCRYIVTLLRCSLFQILIFLLLLEKSGEEEVITALLPGATLPICSDLWSTPCSDDIIPIPPLLHYRCYSHSRCVQCYYIDAYYYPLIFWSSIINT